MNKKTIPFSDELIRDIASKYGTPSISMMKKVFLIT